MKTLIKNISKFQAIVLFYSLDIELFTYKYLIHGWLNPIKEKANKNAIIALILNKNDKLGNKKLDEKEGKTNAKKNEVLFF